VLGVCAVAFSLVAAKQLMRSNESAAGGGAKPAAKGAPTATPTVPGLTTLGTVDAPNGIARVDAPALPALSGMTVVDVKVKNGQEVKVDDVLIQFDDSLFVEKVHQAHAELVAAQQDQLLAQKQIDDQPQLVKLQKLAVEKAQLDLKFATEALKRGNEQLERRFQTNNPATLAPWTDAEKERERRDTPELLKGELAVESLTLAVTKEQTELERLQSKPIQSAKAMADAKVKRLEATEREAQAAVDACKLKARVPGVVEQVAAVKGMTFGPTTRTPAMYIVPAGKRIVWAEVEAEFAHKIDGQLGKKVTIYDSHNFSNGYEGIVARIGTSFLPKRGSADTFTTNATRVLECEIDVVDAAPAGKPPLRVGQPVRVVFGQ
jgi:multidrug resistance efflux pump